MTSTCRTTAAWTAERPSLTTEQIATTVGTVADLIRQSEAIIATAEIFVRLDRIPSRSQLSIVRAGLNRTRSAMYEAMSVVSALVVSTRDLPTLRSAGNAWRELSEAWDRNSDTVDLLDRHVTIR